MIFIRKIIDQGSIESTWMDGWQILSFIAEPGLMFLDPSKRVFWGSLLSSGLIIVLLSGKKRLQNLKIITSPQIWWHPSSRADLKIILINSLLRGVLLPSSWLAAAGIAATVSWLLLLGLGGRPQLHWHPVAIMSLYSLFIFIGDDFARFFTHYLQHRLRFLWVFHQLHHSATVLTPLTLYRSHPIDIIIARGRNILVYGLITGIFYFCFGSTISGWDILGVDALGFLFNLAGANLRHSQVWIHFGRFEPWLISPAAHQIHHSRNPQHYDKNFGVCLAIWDRIWKCHYDPRPYHEPLEYGLHDSPMSAPEQNLWNLYFTPFKELFADLTKKKLTPELIPLHKVRENHRNLAN